MAEADRDKWDARYASEGARGLSAPAWLEELDEELPRGGRALDVAAGSGRVALWAAGRGLSAVAVDISPVGLSLASDEARARGLSLRTVERDLDEDPRLPEGPYALVSCFHYRQPSLWPRMKEALAPGGVLMAELATWRNLERHAHPSRRWLAHTNELLLCAAGLEIVYYRQGWLKDPGGERHLARLLARRSVGRRSRAI